MTRAIDTHEILILQVLDLCDSGESLTSASAYVAPRADAVMAPDRLAHLVRVWCAVAGETPPL